MQLKWFIGIASWFICVVPQNKRGKVSAVFANRRRKHRWWKGKRRRSRPEQPQKVSVARGITYKHIPICETYPLDNAELRDKME